MIDKTKILVDSHVHIYDCFDFTKFINCALANFKNVSVQLGSNKFIGILFLTETKELNYFLKLKNNEFSSETTRANLISLKNSEDCSLIFKNSDDNYLIFIAGRQIITREKLELLALGTTQRVKNNLGLKESLQQIVNVNAICVLPWGFAKWTGIRKKIVNNFLENNKNSNYFVGDNSGRLAIGTTPKLFGLARNYGKIVLRGSDPLPLTSQEDKVGSFGFILDGDINLEFPAKEIKRILLNLKQEPQIFGDLEKPFRFTKNQFLMQFRKLF